MLLATTVGSVGGLVFGLTSLNRPLLNAAVFYLLGAAAALRDRANAPVPLFSRGAYEERMAAARAGMDDLAVDRREPEAVSAPAETA